MKYVWKTRDFFYNNGIVNLFWATQAVFSVPYQRGSTEFTLQPLNSLKLTLYPHQMVIEGEEADIREWYKEISYFFIHMGLEKVPRIVFDPESGQLKEGYSFRQRPYSARIWGTAIGSKLISAPSLNKKLPEQQVEKAIQEYEAQSGKTLDQLDKEGLFKKKWKKDGVYVQASLDKIKADLFKDRHQFQATENAQCEICGSPYVKFNGENYRRDSQTYPTVIGLGYSGFKEFMQNTKMIVCAFCDLALRYNFFWSFYVDGNPKILVHIDYPDLLALFDLKNSVFQIKMENVADLNQNTNIPYPSMKYYASAERAILGLALYIADRINTEKNFEIDLVTGEKSHLLRLISFYFDSTKISGLTEYHQFNRLVKWLSEQKREALVTPLQKDLFKLKARNNQYIVETKLLRNLIEFRDISAPLAEIASLKIRGEKADPGSAGLYIPPYPVSGDFENLIVNFYQHIKEFAMNDQQLQLLKDYGWAMGTLARAMDDLAIFYELREAKKFDHVITVLRNFSFKILREQENVEQKGEYARGALGRFIGKDMDIVRLFESLQDQWAKARDLLLFFAVNNYLKKYDKN